MPDQAYVAATPSLRRRLKPRQLELLAALGRAPSLSAAAREVHLSQPAASRLLALAARELGVPLFERSGRSLRPTAAGRALVRHAARLMGEMDRAQAELAAIREGRAGSVAIGMGTGAAHALVPEALSRLLAEGREIAITLREGPVGELLAWLRDGRLDLVAGRIEPALLGEDLAGQPLYDPPIRFVAGAHHPLARARNVGWRELLKEEWILPEAGTPTRAWLEAAFRRAGARPARSLVESSSIPANLALLARRRMVWVVSADIAASTAAARSVAVLRATVRGRSGALLLVQARGRLASPAAQRVEECFREAARRLSGEG